MSVTNMTNPDKAREAARQGPKSIRGQHVLYLATHGEEEEGEEVYNKDGPVHRDVERLEERAEQRDDGSAC